MAFEQEELSRCAALGYSSSGRDSHPTASGEVSPATRFDERSIFLGTLVYFLGPADPDEGRQEPDRGFPGPGRFIPASGARGLRGAGRGKELRRT